jgi:hypothetical protein
MLALLFGLWLVTAAESCLDKFLSDMNDLSCLFPENNQSLKEILLTCCPKGLRFA